LLGCAPSLRSKDPAERRAAVDRITSQEALASLVLRNQYTDVGLYAVDKLNDQNLLAKVVVQAAEPEIVKRAISRLSDRAILAKVANEVKDWDAREAVLEKLPEQKQVAELMAEGSYHNEDRSPHWDAKICIARMRFALDEPRIKLRFPRLELEPNMELTKRAYEEEELSESYSPHQFTRKGFTGKTVQACGEGVKLAFRQDGRLLAEESWSTSFPSEIPESAGPPSDSYCPYFFPANVSGEDLMKQLLHQGVFTQADLVELGHSFVPEVRYGAAANLGGKSGARAESQDLMGRPSLPLLEIGQSPKLAP
jgi:hypothetical protein